MDIVGLEYVGLAYFISTDTEVCILTHRSEAYDMGHDNVRSCILTKHAVCDETSAKVKVSTHASICPFEAYDMGHNNIPSCIPTKSAVCDATTTRVRVSICALIYPFEAYDISGDEVFSCIATKPTVCDKTTVKVKA